MLDKKAQNMMLKLKFVQNLATLDVNNSSLETVIFDPKEMLGILDLRLVGYYKIKQRILQQNLSRYYRPEWTNTPCEQINKFINTLKKEKEETKEKLQWLEPDDEKRDMSDREILNECVYLEKSYLSDSERNKSWICYINIGTHLV